MGCSVAFDASIFFCKLPGSAHRKLVKIYATVIDGFRHKFIILQEKPKDVTMQDGCSFMWVFSKTPLSLYCIVLLIYRFVTLAEACKQVKSCSNLLHLRLAKIFILSPNCIQAKLFSGQAPGNILIHPKITTPRLVYPSL